MVQFEKRFVSGHALQACRQEQLECAGFSRCAVTSKVQGLKPFKVVAFGGIAEAMTLIRIFSQTAPLPLFLAKHERAPCLSLAIRGRGLNGLAVLGGRELSVDNR